MEIAQLGGPERAGIAPRHLVLVRRSPEAVEGDDDLAGRMVELDAARPWQKGKEAVQLSDVQLRDDDGFRSPAEGRQRVHDGVFGMPLGEAERGLQCGVKTVRARRGRMADDLRGGQAGVGTLLTVSPVRRRAPARTRPPWRAGRRLEAWRRSRIAWSCLASDQPRAQRVLDSQK